MTGSIPGDTSGSSGGQNESTLKPPGPPGTPTYPPPISVAASRSTLGSSSSSPASVDQIGRSMPSDAPALRPRPSQTLATGAGISSSPYRSDSIASPTFSDVNNASDGVASPYKSGRIRNRRQRPPIAPRTFDDVLSPLDEDAAVAIMDDHVESEYWDSETEGDLDEIPKAMMGGWNSRMGRGNDANDANAVVYAAAKVIAQFEESDRENEQTPLAGDCEQKGQEDIQMEDVPLGDDKESTIVDNYLREPFSED